MKYKAIIFDLDGTLLDSIEDLKDSMNSVLESHGFPTHDTETFKYFVGTGMRNLVMNSLPPEERSQTIIDNCLSQMRKEYGKRWADKTKPYEGIPQLLDALTEKNIKMAVLSNKIHDFTTLIVDRLLKKWNFDVVFGERASVPRKPNPAGALEISSLLDIPPEKFLYLGDSDTDMETAKNANMYPIGVLWGFRKAHELLAAGAKKLIHHPMELLEFLDAHS
jgi:phosphoglycolate phosphatase